MWGKKEENGVDADPTESHSPVLVEMSDMIRASEMSDSVRTE